MYIWLQLRFMRTIVSFRFITLFRYYLYFIIGCYAWWMHLRWTETMVLFHLLRSNCSINSGGSLLFTQFMYIIVYWLINFYFSFRSQMCSKIPYFRYQRAHIGIQVGIYGPGWYFSVLYVILYAFGSNCIVYEYIIILYCIMEVSNNTNGSRIVTISLLW